MANHTYQVGDTVHLQSEGGPIGLELTGAVSRPFMMRWDRLYLKKVRKAGMIMEMYERYVDDSNQVATVPHPGSRYDLASQKLVIDEDFIQLDETEEARVARVLKSIANSVQDGIIMEEDSPEKHENNKMGVLDMQCWINEEGYVLYEHFEKAVSSKLAIKANSAQSENCKRNMHVQELARRILNCSPRLDWQEHVAPVLTDYMCRMMVGGYPETYRRQTLKHAIGIHTKMKEEDSKGIRPIYRPKDWQVDERRQKKKNKKHNWSSTGGYIAPIFVPPTPDGQLAKELEQLLNMKQRQV